jgi:hypothetical protein
MGHFLILAGRLSQLRMSANQARSIATKRSQKFVTRWQAGGGANGELG